MPANECHIVTNVTNQTLSHCHKQPGTRFVTRETCDTCDNVTAFSGVLEPPKVSFPTESDTNTQQNEGTNER